MGEYCDQEDRKKEIEARLDETIRDLIRRFRTGVADGNSLLNDLPSSNEYMTQE